MSKQPQTYNNILSYLDEVDPDVSNAYRECSLESLFNPRDKNGITFLLPDKRKNAAFYAEITNTSLLDDPDDKSDIINKLAALVIFDNLNSPDVFKNHADDIPNGLRQHIEIDLAGCTTNTIKFKCGAVAELDKRFRDASAKKNLNVYMLAAAGITTSGPDAKFLHNKTGAAAPNRRKKPAAAPQVEENNVDDDEVDEDSHALRVKIASETENLYMMERIQYYTSSKRSGKKRSELVRNVYLERVFSFINFIINNCSDVTTTALFNNRIAPLLSFENIDFYIVFEPHRVKGRYLIPNDVIRRWYSNQGVVNLTSVSNYIDKTLDTTGRSIVQQDRLKIQQAIDDQPRDKVLAETQPRRIPELICGAYKTLTDTNKIAGIGPIFPEELAAFYRTNTYLKIHQDEARYITNKLFDDLESSPFDKNVFEAILSIYKRMASTDVGESSLRLLNPSTIKHMIGPENKIQEIKSFVNSRFFLFIPMTTSDRSKFAEQYDILEEPSAEGNGIWVPIDKRAEAILAAKANSSYDDGVGFASEVSRSINVLKQNIAAGVVDAKTKEELAAILKNLIA
jgi:hypothetical protein